MAIKKTKEPVQVDAAQAPVDDRQARWEVFLENAAKDNATFAQQKANGEFDTIPDSFK